MAAFTLHSALPATAATKAAGVKRWSRPCSAARLVKRNAQTMSFQSAEPASVQEEETDSSSSPLQPHMPGYNPSASTEEFATESESRDFAVAMAAVAHETKGEDICVLHVAPLIYWTSYMVFVTVFSRPQLGAILGKMEKEAAEKWGRKLPEGGHPSMEEWEVLDFGDAVIHVFTERQREFYDLEGFYGAAQEVELPFLNDGSMSGPSGSSEGNASWAVQA